MYAKTFSKQLTRLGVSAICLLALAPLSAQNIHASRYHTSYHMSMQHKRARTRLPLLVAHQYARPASFTSKRKSTIRPQTHYASYHFTRYYRIHKAVNAPKYSRKSIKPKNAVHHYRKVHKSYRRIRSHKKEYRKSNIRYRHVRKQRKHFIKPIRKRNKSYKGRIFKKHTIKRYKLHTAKKIKRLIKHHVIKHRIRRKKHIAKRTMVRVKSLKHTAHFVNPVHINHNMASSYRSILKIAKSKLGDAYEWGGNGPKAFDCSGFTKYIFQNGAHKYLDRLAGDQYYDNEHIPASQRQPGDLVFFGTSLNNITHVGLYLGNDKMIDAQLNGVEIEKVTVPWWHAVGYSRPLA